MRHSQTVTAGQVQVNPSNGRVYSLGKSNFPYLGKTLEQGSPTPGPRTGSSPRPVRKRAARQEVSGRHASEASSAAPHRSHYCLNHPPSPPPPTPVHGNTVFHETGAKKVGDRCVRGQRRTRTQNEPGESQEEAGCSEQED